MAEERTDEMISRLEVAERRHSAEAGAPAPAVTGDERAARPDDTAQDAIARAAGALGPDTVTDPLELMSYDDRPGQGVGRHGRDKRR